MTWQELASTEVSKAAPPVAVTGLTCWGVGLPDVVLILTTVYTVFQLYFLLRDKWWRQRGKHKSKK